VRRALALCALLGVASAGGKELLENGDVERGKGWGRTPGAATVTMEVDRKRGAKRPGSLRIANTDAEDTTAHNWFTRFDVPGPGRLKLTVQVRTDGLAPDAEANVMVQLYPSEGNAVAYASCVLVPGDRDWHERKAVFDVPAECAYVRILAYLVGKGTAWYDDFSVTATEEPVTPPPAPKRRRVKDDPLWKLVRSAAEGIPWLFDPDAARDRAAKERRPLLLYVRCVDDSDALASAQTTLRAEAVAWTDDGLKKDVLFRVGPLSDPAVADVIARRYVPLLLTYHLGTHGNTGGDLSPWSHTAGGPAATLAMDREEGAKQKGALFIRNTDATQGRLHQWMQTVEAPPAGTMRLEASIRTKDLAKGAEACVMLQCRGADGKVALYARVKEVREDRGWKRDEAGFEVPEGCARIVLMAYLAGEGEAWFDDIALVPEGGKESLVTSGHIDPSEGMDPLREFGLSAKEIVTPALVAVGPDGVVAKLHRIGTMSTDLVDLWLREAARAWPSRATRPDEQLADGELERVAAGKGADAKARLARARALLRLGALDEAEAALKGVHSRDAAFVRGGIALRRGAWADGLQAFLDAGETEEARFFQAWCMHRLGRQAEAEQEWRAIAGPTPFGRRAAACVLPTGPRLWLAMSERAWPRGRGLPEETEKYADAFDGAESVRALLELQRADGSFGGHDGATGEGYHDGAITSLGAEALALWGARLPAGLRERAEGARERAVGYLEAWARRGNTGGDAFNNPYVLLELLRAKRKEAARAVIARIGKNQLADGNWTVYQPERPASFNTALNVIALARARDDGFGLPEGALARGVAALAAMRQAGDLFPYSTKTGHEWMTTEHGSIARDPLCEHALLAGGQGDRAKLEAALARFERFAGELRLPTKKYYDYFNSRGHGGYYFFFAHRNAHDAAALAGEEAKARVRAFVREAVLAAREGDGTFMDHQMIGRAYATAQALVILLPSD
jgi:hypothetical protein